MNCPNCGAANAPESKFCVGCGAAMPAEAPAQAAGAETASVKSQIADTLKPVTSKVNKKVIFGAVAVVALLVVISVLCAIFGGGNGFVEMKKTIMFEKTGENEYSVFVDKKLLSETIESKSRPTLVSNIDGKVAAILAEDTLYVVKGTKLKEVANDVTSFQLSVEGKGIAYTTKDKDDEYPTLFLYTVSNGKKAEISDKAYGRYVISPDGKSVAYFVAPDKDDKEPTPELNLFKGKKSTKITDDEVNVLGMSNSGKQIYVTSRNDDGDTILYSYNAKGNKQKLGEMSGSGFMFNDDHTQIMFKGKKDKMYLAIKGKEAKVMAKDAISLILAPNANSDFADGSTYPVSKLYNHVYRSGDEVWMIKKNSDKNVKLVSKASYVQLDQSAEYIYYNYDNEELRVAKISHGEKASEKAKVLVEENIRNYVVTSNRKFVYYIEDEALYSVNGKKGGTAKTVANDDVSGLALSGKDKAYYVMDGDLYACSNGKKGSKVLGDVNGVGNMPNGSVFAYTEDALYCTTGSKKLKKVCDLETKKSNSGSDYGDYGDYDDYVDYLPDDLKDYLP